jgi:hypothetical protein
MDSVLPAMAISQTQLRMLRQRMARKEAKKLLGETDEQSKLYKDLITPTNEPAKRLSTEQGLFFYPGISTPIPVVGPITIKHMCVQFFKETLPTIFPEASNAAKQADINALVESAMQHGMFAFFGDQGIMNQVLAKNPNRLLKTSNQMASVKSVFDDVTETLVWSKDLTSPPAYQPSKDVIGTHLLAWRRA